MAEKNIRKKLRPEDIGSLPQQPLEDFQKVLDNLRTNWVQYVGGAALVVVCLLAYVLFQASRTTVEHAANDLYTKALLEEDDAKKVGMLLEAAEQGSSLQAEMLYVAGESAIRAGEYDRAADIMNRVLGEHGNTAYASRAADALAFLKENAGEYDAALAAYADVKSKWPKSLEALRAPAKIAALHEKLGNVEAAVAAYREQIDIFPDSTFAQKASTELDRIKIRHPQYFPDDEELKTLAALEIPVPLSSDEMISILQEDEVEEAADESEPAVESEETPQEDDGAGEVEETADASEETDGTEESGEVSEEQ